jgi:transglutaminase-like putative cysteine protease
MPAESIRPTSRCEKDVDEKVTSTPVTRSAPRVHRLTSWNFGYEHANMTRTAQETLHDRTGVCRDFTHLAVAFCRCMNIPARYCTGYLGDIGVPPVDYPMDFSAWFEVFLGGQYLRRVPQHATHRQGVAATPPTSRSATRSAPPH